jgi:hypothetical protein
MINKKGQFLKGDPPHNKGKKRKIIKHCLYCNDEFITNRDKARFCSRSCFSKKSIGHPFFGGTNKGMHWKIKDTSKMRLSRIGKKHTEEAKRKMGKTKIAEKNPEWKGDEAGYSSIHNWVRRWKKIPEYCEFCGKEGKKNGRNWNIQQANIDHNYRRVLDDYIALCDSCHKKYDRQNNLNKYANNL